MKALMTIEAIERKICLIRCQKVIMDADLAELYGTTTKAFNQAIKRNRSRFPEDFMLQLTDSEMTAMRSQFVTASKRNIRHLPRRSSKNCGLESYRGLRRMGRCDEPQAAEHRGGA